MKPTSRPFPLLALLLLAAPAAPAQDPPAPGKPDPAVEADRRALEELVAQAIPKVEKARGLKFSRPVPAAPVTGADFVERYMRDFTRVLGGEERAARTSRLLARLGVLEAGADLRALLGKFLEGSVAANYDPETGKVTFLPGIPRTLQTMVHELTHAVDDQNFDMKAQIAAWGTNFDRALAYGALAEGDAESVEYRFMTGGGIARQPLDALRQMAEAMAQSVLQRKFGGTPPAVVLAFKSQYLEGLVFAEHLRRLPLPPKEGEAPPAAPAPGAPAPLPPPNEEAVNAAFRDPPASTEQVLHPEKFAAREAPVVLALPAPAEGVKVPVTVVLGELCTRIVLQSKGVEGKAASAAAAGWGGDLVALVELPAGEALLWTTAWDTEEDAREFLAAAGTAFPARTDAATGRVTGLVGRGRLVDVVEAPLDALPAVLEMAKAATAR